MIFNITNGGGSDLAVKIVGSTVKPENPKEGTIWVNTDQKISAWSMRSTEPGSPVEGMVWLTINAEAAVNALKKNEINIKPLRANQYTGGAWVLKPAELYRGGAWSALKIIPDFTYTGEYELVNDADDRITDAADGNWKIRLLTSGILTFQALNGAENGIDVFLVGGGGGSSAAFGNYHSTSGAGGGYTHTEKGISVETGVSYQIKIGAGGNAGSGNGGYGTDGGVTSAFGFSAKGGSRGGTGSGSVGGNGGSGGGGSSRYASGGNGGSDGSNGGSGTGGEAGGGGTGQRTTTREFGEKNGRLYAGGGGGGHSDGANGTGGAGGGGSGGSNPGKTNTGGGAGGAVYAVRYGAKGGSGIVVIRNKR